MPRRGDEREPAGGGTKANVTSLLGRTSRFTLLPPNGNRRSAAVLAGALRPPPEDARRAITFGRGSGSAGCAALDRHPNLASYSRDPRSPRRRAASRTPTAASAAPCRAIAGPRRSDAPTSAGFPAGSTAHPGVAPATARRARSSRNTSPARPRGPDPPPPVALRVETASGTSRWGQG